MTVTVKITSKGQLTLPRSVRNALDSNTVEIDVVDGEVRIRPVKGVAGVLADFAAEKRNFKEARKQVWGEVAD